MNDCIVCNNEVFEKIKQKYDVKSSLGHAILHRTPLMFETRYEKETGNFCYEVANSKNISVYIDDKLKENKALIFKKGVIDKDNIKKVEIR